MYIFQSRLIRNALIALMMVAAILMILVLPIMGFDTVNPVVKSSQERMLKQVAAGNPQAPLLAYAMWLVSFFFPFWSTMTFIAGIVLLVIALPFYRGESWTRGLALLCFAVPSIGGAYMLVPWTRFVGSQGGAGFPPPLVFMAVGLIPYFAILLAEKTDLKQQVVDCLVFLMLGVTAAENFANGHAAFRIYMGHPARPLLSEGVEFTYFGFVTLWLAMGLLVAAIYLLGQRKRSGWYAGLLAGLITTAASGVTHFGRKTTDDYLYGSIMGLVIVIMMLIPFFKQRLVSEKEA